jgi:hypothetical protein
MAHRLYLLPLVCAALAVSAPVAAADPGPDVPHAATFLLTCPDRTVTVTALITGEALVFHDVASEENFRVTRLVGGFLIFDAPGFDHNTVSTETCTFEGQLPPAGRTLTATGFWTGAEAH